MAFLPNSPKRKYLQRYKEYDASVYKYQIRKFFQTYLPNILAQRVTPLKASYT